MSRLLNYTPSRHDMYIYHETRYTTESPEAFNEEFYLLAHKENLSCLSVHTRGVNVPNSNILPRATLISPLHVIGSRNNSFEVGDEFSFYIHTDFLVFNRHIVSKTNIGDNLILGVLNDTVHHSAMIPARNILSVDGDVDTHMVGEPILVADQDGRIGTREVLDVRSSNIVHEEGPMTLPPNFLVDDKIIEFFPSDDGSPVFYTGPNGELILLGLIIEYIDNSNASENSIEYISRYAREINDILDTYGYSLKYINPFESITEITPDDPTITVKNRIYWHAAITSGSEYNPDSDPLTQNGISTLVSFENGEINSNYLSNNAYAIDRLCLFPNNISIPMYSANYDIAPGYFVFQINGEYAGRLFNGSSNIPVEIKTSDDVLNAGNFYALNYMLFGAYKNDATGCVDSDEPDEWFDHNDTSIISNITVTNDDAAELTNHMKPYKDVFSDGSDAGFYFKMQDIGDVEKLGCCDIIVTDDCVS